ARSILRMVESTLEMVKGIDKSQFPSQVTKDYYDIIRELMSILLLLDGWKTQGEGAHRNIIRYIEKVYKSELTRFEISVIDELREIRNQVAYDGFFVKESYLDGRLKNILMIIERLQNIISKKLQ
ncbi:MAG TPA: hypothetical protein VJJ75_01260, partial [Candidatus Nanoarchaeia archaeon]|nr:hypothetical protein [Candidatus Nanoarchaeia archaeon]